MNKPRKGLLLESKLDIFVIGSRAAYEHGVDMGRLPSDQDFVVNWNDWDMIVGCYKRHNKIKAMYPLSADKIVLKTEQGLIIEADLSYEDDDHNHKLMEIIRNDPDTKHVKLTDEIDWHYASPSVQYMLKMSHRYKKNSPHFKKTMADIQMLRYKGAEIKPEWKEFYEERIKLTYNYGHPSLMQSKSDFFSGDGIEYEWDHDSLHEAVKHRDKPAYQFFLKDEVMVDMDKFETLPYHTQLDAVVEESCVLAAERSQLAFANIDLTPRESFLIALEKVCTSITSGRFREFAWENYYTAIKMYDAYNSDEFNYMTKVNEGIENGIVKEFKHANY